jgi:hypothetical protein
VVVVAGHLRLLRRRPGGRAGRTRPLTAAGLADVTGEFSWASAIALGITLPALLFADGRLRSPRWRVVVATALFGATVAPPAGSLMPGQLQETPPPLPTHSR